MIVTSEEACRVETERCYYTPERVMFWLRPNNWATLCCLAETPSTAMGLLDKGQTRESPRSGVRQRSYHGDQLNHATIKADLERAWRHLVPGLPLQVVWACTRGKSPGRYAGEIQRRKADVIAAFEEACKQMAQYLGWVEASDGGD